MAHPSLGNPPRDLTAGFPAAAERLRAARTRIGTRALEVALSRDPSIRERHGELGLRKFLRDSGPLLDRLVIALAAADRTAVADWADWVAPVYRRNKVPMDDLIHLTEGVRAAVPAILTPEEQTLADEALVEAIAVFRWNRRIAGDARKRNRILAAIYKGA